MAKMRGLFVAVGVLVLRIIAVGAAETAPESQAPWTHKNSGECLPISIVFKIISSSIIYRGRVLYLN